METAGQGAFDVMRAVYLPGSGPVAVVTGKGNNAGDGFVVARLCREAGIPVVIHAVIPPRSFPAGDAADQAALCARQSVAVHPANDPAAFAAAISQAGLVVDGLLGTGLHGDVRPPYDRLIETLNGAAVDVLSLDVPSGMCGDRGIPLGHAVNARWTATFGALKTGLVTATGKALAGQVHLVPLPFPAAAWDAVPEQP